MNVLESHLACQKTRLKIAFLLAFLLVKLVTPSPALAQTILPLTREEALALYFASFETSTPAAEWTGNIASCLPGDTAALFKDATLTRINYFRAMAGLNQVILLDDFNTKAQAAALMMGAANAVSHSPPATWPCYSANGALAASSGNLTMSATGPSAINLYMQDPGPANQAVGHRRWLLNPYRLQMGTGDVFTTQGRSLANVLWLIGGASDENASLRDGFVAWPPTGYVPYKVVYPRWSFSLPNADFGNATVTASLNGSNAPLTLLPVANGYALNTIVWEWQPNNTQFRPAPQVDSIYTITIAGVVVDGIPQTFTYTVTVIDVNKPPTNLSLGTIEYTTDGTIEHRLYENQPVGTIAGILAAQDPESEATIAYRLVAGPGDEDNGSFSIDGNKLRTKTSFDYESKASYSIRVEANDGRSNGTTAMPLTVTLNNANDAPHSILLTPGQITENATPASTVGLLAALDQDMLGGLSTQNSHTFGFVDGEGSTGNSFFTLVTTPIGIELQTKTAFDYELATSQNIRLRVIDAEGAAYTQTLTIAIDNVNEPPLLQGTPAPAFINANQNSTSYLAFSDPDAEDQVTVTIKTAPNFLSSLQIEGNTIQLTWTPTLSDHGVHDVELILQDKAGLTTEIHFRAIIFQNLYFLPSLLR